MDKLVWNLPLGARFEFEPLENGHWNMVHYNREQGRDFEEVHFDIVPALARAAQIILEASVITDIEIKAEYEAKKGMH